jgi:hypothetical protein
MHITCLTYIGITCLAYIKHVYIQITYNCMYQLVQPTRIGTGFIHILLGPLLRLKKYFRHKFWWKYWRFCSDYCYLVFAKKCAQHDLFKVEAIIRRGLVKIAENCDHNIDPCCDRVDFSPISSVTKNNCCLTSPFKKQIKTRAVKCSKIEQRIVK